MDKMLGGAAGIGLIACILLYGLWQKALVEVAKLEGQVQTLETVNDMNQTTISGLQESATANAEIIQEMGEKNDEIREETNAALAEINELRASELERALREPFERGNASYDRIVTSLVRFSGDVQRTYDPGDAATDNPDDTISP